MSSITSELSRRALGRLGVAAATLAAVGVGRAVISPAQAQAKAPAGATPSGGTIKGGGLHSLAGTMGISETTLEDVMLMVIAEQKKKSGLLGKKLGTGVGDPPSHQPPFARKGREVI